MIQNESRWDLCLWRMHDSYKKKPDGTYVTGLVAQEMKLDKI
jgi:hypothetical protein